MHESCLPFCLLPLSFDQVAGHSGFARILRANRYRAFLCHWAFCPRYKKRTPACGPTFEHPKPVHYRLIRYQLSGLQRIGHPTGPWLFISLLVKRPRYGRIEALQPFSLVSEQLLELQS